MFIIEQSLFVFATIKFPLLLVPDLSGRPTTTQKADYLQGAKVTRVASNDADPSKSEVKELEIAKIPMLQGIAIQLF